MIGKGLIAAAIASGSTSPIALLTVRGSLAYSAR
jgi:hypothetical protein